MSLTLLDWRRRVAALYAAVRAEPDPAAGHELLAGGPGRPAGPPPAARRCCPRTGPTSRVPGWRRTTRPCASSSTSTPTSSRTASRCPPPPTAWCPSSASRRAPAGRRAGAGRPGRVVAGLLRRRGVRAGQGRAGRDARPTAPAATCSTPSRVPTWAATSTWRPGAATLVVDLNFAYNPSCAYDPAWVCPLAPPGNRLAAPVRGGELYPVRAGRTRAERGG